MLWTPPIKSLPYAHSTSVISDINGLYPPFKEKIIQLQKDIQAAGLPHKVFETFRSAERQLSVYKQGKSKIKTNGMHYYLIAADLVPCIGKNGWTWDRPAKEWQQFGQLVEALGLTWGGRWKGFPDMPHVQGCTVKQQNDVRNGIYPDYK